MSISRGISSKRLWPAQQQDKFDSLSKNIRVSRISLIFIEDSSRIFLCLKVIYGISVRKGFHCNSCVQLQMVGYGSLAPGSHAGESTGLDNHGPVHATMRTCALLLCMLYTIQYSTIQLYCQVSVH